MASKSASHTLRKAATNLYEKICAGPLEKLYDQSTLSSYCDVPPSSTEFLQILQSLIDDFQLSVHSSGSQTLWKCIPPSQGARLKSLTADERLVYRQVEAVENAGIWKRDVGRKTNLHQTVLDRCLKGLESKGYIKTVKNVQYPARKTYMLAHLAPAEDVSGGPWYEDGELDVNFIDGLRKAIFSCIRDRSFRKIDPVRSAEEHGSNGVPSDIQALPQQMYFPQPAGYEGYATLPQVAEWLSLKNITDEPLLASDIQQIIDLLCWDGLIIKMGYGGYKAKLIPKNTRKDRDGLTDAPCGRCPVLELCEEGGPVSASNCVYLDRWLLEKPVQC